MTAVSGVADIPDETLLVRDLRVVGSPSEAAIVEEIGLALAPGEILGVVGESGSGKTTLGLALLHFCRRGTRFAGGEVTIRRPGEAGAEQSELSSLGESGLRRLRGRTVAYVPQSPAAALNPALRIGTQLRECLPEAESTAARDQRISQVLGEVGLPSEDPKFLRRYPHQLSGGQQQRVAIAMAFAARPALIVLDEPTTGLDVSTQKKVLNTVRELCAEYRAAAVYISHDMAVVAELSHRIAVMYSGRVVETGTAEAVLNRPQHPYTARLLTAVPDLTGRRGARGIPGHAPSPLHRPEGCAFAPRCELATDECRRDAPGETVTGDRESGGSADSAGSAASAASAADGARHVVRCHHAGQARIVHIPMPPPIGGDAEGAGDGEAEGEAAGPRPVLHISGVSAGYGRSTVLHEIDLSVQRGQCTALLGESGSGKTTLSRAVAGLHGQWKGRIELDGEPLVARGRKRSREHLRAVQYVFQNPYDSLNPTRTVGEAIATPVRYLCAPGTNVKAAVERALAQASLRPDLAARYPDQLSGGERQRVAIARALAVEPRLLVCDEVTSALDVSVQSSIVELLQSLQRELGLTLLFVTHDIALVRNVAQRVAVLEQGRIVENGPVDEVLTHPRHEYTQSLLRDTPAFELAADGEEAGQS
jgi:peptide/nickel transport system ATP-binding protein